MTKIKFSDSSRVLALYRPAKKINFSISSLNYNPLYLVERNLIAGAVVEQGGPGRGVGGDPLGVLDGAAVLAEGGDAGGPEGVAADPPRQARRRGPASDHDPGVPAVQRPAG